MRLNENIIMIGLAAVIVALPFIFHFFLIQDTSEDDSSNGSSEGDEQTNEDEDEDNDNEAPTIYWGVDSASYTEENLFQCVIDNFGAPEVWGRYLEDREGISSGLDASEIELLHENDIQILIIYNHVNDARGYENGINHANQAIQFAENINVPEGIAIFGDIEPNYPVDSAFMEGWYETFVDSIYKPGIYGVFNEGSELFAAYEAMSEEAQKNIVVWTAYPQAEITTKENAPAFNPEGPELAPVLGWQYAIDAETCNIDTNLFIEDMINYLW